MSFLPGLSSAVSAGVGGMMGLGTGLAVGAMGGGVKSPNSALWSGPLNEAKNLWAGAQGQAMGDISQQRNQFTQNFSPYMSQLQGMAQPYGQAALGGMQGFQNLMQNPGSITQDPFYLARLGAGQGAIENSAAAKGMQLSGTNLQDLGGFASNLAADTFNQRLNQFGQQNQIGQQGLFQGLQGMGQIEGLDQGWTQMFNQANYQGVGGQADALGALAQANSAAAIGKMNSQSQQQSSMMGGLASLGGMAMFAGM